MTREEAFAIIKDLLHELEEDKARALTQKIYADVVAVAVDDERACWLDYSNYFVDQSKLS